MVALKRSLGSFSSSFHKKCDHDKMQVDIIVLSILSALTSGPLAIQRQVKALDRRFDFNVGLIPLALSTGVLLIGTLVAILVVLSAPYNPHDDMLAVNIVLQIMSVLFVMVPVVVVGGLVIWFFTATHGT